MNELQELLSDWRATYGEIFPHRNPEAMPVDDAMLALAVLMRREQRMATASAGKVMSRTVTRISNYNPTDPE